MPKALEASYCPLSIFVAIKSATVQSKQDKAPTVSDEGKNVERGGYSILYPLLANVYNTLVTIE